VHLTLREDAKPVHARAFPVPQALMKPTKTEVNRLTNIDVFEKAYDSEWAAPTFIKQKKTGDIRILTDFRGLNSCLIRTPFPLPKISDLLQRLTGFRYASAIDLSMGYYHIPLDEYSQKLCTTIFPWGKYRYKRLPMGIKTSPDIFQAVINDLLGDLDFAQVYLDDILITSNGSFQDHLQKLDIVFKRLENANFRANLLKCFFAQEELEYLGYWLTRRGLQPQPKKVEAILRLTPPKTSKRQLRHFLGMVNFYRDMWRMRSHLLAPLSALVSPKVKFEWRREHQDAFEQFKTLISKETLLTFPNLNEPFHIYTDASKYQLGAVIMQNDKPIAFYSRKLNSAQKKYTTGEQELLSIVETLKEFRNILFGQQIVIHTDHRNILYNK
jgi:putative transposase